MRKIHRRNSKSRIVIISVLLVLTLCFTIAYSAFSTNLSINTKGNVINLKNEMNSRIPKDDLLVWCSVDDENNKETYLIDKTGNGNNCILENFTNNFDNKKMSLDGIDDYININGGSLNGTDSKGKFSWVWYGKLDKASEREALMGNTMNGGYMALLVSDKELRIEYRTVYDTYISVTYSDFLTTDYYTVIVTYDDPVLKLYVNGNMVGSSEYGKIYSQVFEGFQYGIANNAITAMDFRESLVYSRALKKNEIKVINDSLVKKYSV